VAQVQPESFLTLHYRLAGPDGADIVNTFPAQPATLSLGRGELAPAFEARLLGLEEGTRTTFRLDAGEAFGLRNPQLLQRVKLALLREHATQDEDYAVGDVVEFPAPDGRGFNHPLAGQPVTFEVQLIGVL
jgi:FKBP-type peptidyl-prolyl cis-trans isomerase SlpA